MDPKEFAKRQAERRQATQEARDEQYAQDLESLDELIEKHGVNRVTWLEIPYEPGLPVLVIARAPDDREIKRYRTRLKGEDADPAAASVELAEVCREFPDAEAYAKQLKARPGINTQLGALVAKLALGVSEDRGKD